MGLAMMEKRKLINVAAYLLAVAALVAGYLVVSDILRRTYQSNLSAALNNNLSSHRYAIEDWQETRIAEALAHANDPILLEAAQDLLAIKGDRRKLITSDSQKRLRTFFGAFLYLQHFKGYFLIAPDGTSLASSRDVNIGTPNLLLEQPERFQRLLNGEALLTRLTRSDVPLSDSDDIRDNVTNFAAAPLRDANGTVVAILALRLFPKQELFQLLNFVESASSINSYAFNTDGALLSRVHDLSDMHKEGLWTEGQDHILLEPNLLASSQPTASQLTLPVRSSLQGSNGTNIDGYLNYAGDRTVGAWYAFEDLSFGIVVEQNYERAYELLTFFETLTVAAFSIGLLVVSLIFLWMLEASKRVETHRQRMAATLKATRDVNFQVNSYGMVDDVNDAMQSVFGLEPRLVISHPMSRFIDLGDNSQSTFTDAGLRQLAHRTRTQVLRCRGIKADGSTFPIGIRVEPLVLEGKSPVEFLIVAHDYSEIERRESELREALQRAEAGSRTKSSFLSTISHELRSPLISVIAALELLADRAHSTEDRNLLDSSQRSAQLLLGIIDDILDYSRMEADKLELNHHDVALEAILSDVVEMLRWQAWNNDVELIPYCDPGLPLVQGDGLRLRQILLNLTSNALSSAPKCKTPAKWLYGSALNLWMLTCSTW